jgi:asparagine N-glycosylation enzyme membrane subunit Stt3
MRTQLPPNQVFVSWWDYGYYITIEGNQTSVIDNATENTTAIAQVGAIFMSNETQSIKMLKEDFNGTYGPPRYIVVFGTFQDSSTSTPPYPEAGYGDEGKWRWFVEISGNDTLLNNGKPANGKDNLFGNYSIGEDIVNQSSTSSGSLVANPVGQNTTFYKLLYYAHDYLLEGDTAAEAAQAVDLTEINGTSSYYFTLAAIFPSTKTTYSGIDPIVAIYKINYGT